MRSGAAVPGPACSAMAQVGPLILLSSEQPLEQIGGVLRRARRRRGAGRRRAGRRLGAEEVLDPLDRLGGILEQGVELRAVGDMVPWSLDDYRHLDPGSVALAALPLR